MATEHVLPEIDVRNTGKAVPKKTKPPSIPTMKGGGNVKYSDEIVAHAKWLLQTKPILGVAMELNIDPQTVGCWARGITRMHVQPKRR